jgi:hypothetical protein
MGSFAEQDMPVYMEAIAKLSKEERTTLSVDFQHVVTFSEPLAVSIEAEYFRCVARGNMPEACGFGGGAGGPRRHGCVNRPTHSPYLAGWSRTCGRRSKRLLRSGIRTMPLTKRIMSASSTSRSPTTPRA